MHGKSGLVVRVKSNTRIILNAFYSPSVDPDMPTLEYASREDTVAAQYGNKPPRLTRMSSRPEENVCELRRRVRAERERSTSLPNMPGIYTSMLNNSPRGRGALYSFPDQHFNIIPKEREATA